MKKLLALLLVLCLAFSLVLTGCSEEQATTSSAEDASKAASSQAASSGEETSAPAPTQPVIQDTLIGTWQGTIPFGKVVATLIEQDEGSAPLLQYMDFSNIGLACTWEFKEDGTYSIDCDDQDYDVFMEEFCTIFADGTWAYMADVIAKEGGGVTAEEVFGMTKEEFKEEYKSNFSSSMNKEELHEKGQYRDDNGTVYLSEELTEAPNPEEYFKYTFENHQLKVTEMVETEEEDEDDEQYEDDEDDVDLDVSIILPLYFTKVN